MLVMILTILGIGFILVCTSVEGASLSGKLTNSRIKRQVTTPHPTLPLDLSLLLQNTVPLECPDAPSTRKLELSDDQMIEMLHAHGGTYHTDLMAADLQTAQKFPNREPPQHIHDGQDGNATVNPTLDVQTTISNTKLMDDLNKWSSLKTQLVVHAEASRINNTGVHPTVSKVVRDVLTDIDFNLTSLNAPNAPTDSAITTKYLKESLEKLNKEIDEILHGDSDDLQDLLTFVQRHNISLHPRMLQSLEHTSPYDSRHKRTAVASKVDSCFARGRVTDGFVRMCGVCAVTTELDQAVFPRYINEIVCDHLADSTCLTVNNTPHGICKQSYVYEKMLRRKPGGCNMFIESGQMKFVDAFEVFTQKIRSGCECSVDQRSPLSAYVKPPFG